MSVQVSGTFYPDSVFGTSEPFANKLCPVVYCYDELVSCEMIELLPSLPCALWTSGPFVAELGVVLDHCQTKWRAINLHCFLEGLGHNEDLNYIFKKVTVSPTSSQSAQSFATRLDMVVHHKSDCCTKGLQMLLKTKVKVRVQILHQVFFSD